MYTRSRTREQAGSTTSSYTEMMKEKEGAILAANTHETWIRPTGVSPKPDI